MAYDQQLADALKEIEELSERYNDAGKEINRLRKGIIDYLHGDYPRVRKNDKCKHGRYGFEGCEACIDDYFEGLLAVGP